MENICSFARKSMHSSIPGTGKQSFSAWGRRRYSTQNRRLPSFFNTKILKILSLLWLARLLQRCKFAQSLFLFPSPWLCFIWRCVNKQHMRRVQVCALFRQRNSSKLSVSHRRIRTHNFHNINLPFRVHFVALDLLGSMRCFF